MQASKRALFKRGGAACAAAAVLIGSTMTAGAAQAAPSTALAPASIAAEVQPPAAADVESLFAAYVAEYGVQKLEAVTVDAAGNFTIRTGEPATAAPATAAPATTSAKGPAAATVPVKPKLTDDEFKATVDGNVTIDRDNVTGPATSFATDVTNGQGYMFDVPGDSASCSIGWNGFNKAGDPAVITAGHCAADGTSTNPRLTDSTEDEANGGPGFVETLPLGTFGFSQFGGKNNSPATAPADWNGEPDTVNNIGTDVAVIDPINPELNPLAKVTDWTTPADPKASGPKVTGISDAVAGTPICKSGRTTGWTCGTVDEATTIFLVGGTNYDPVTNPDDVRAVRGFSSTDLHSEPGDSGGAIITGTKASTSGLAVGMISAGSADGKTVYGVSLTDALAKTGGYTVKIDLSAPKVTTTAPVFRSTDVTGTVAGAPAGTTVTVTIDGKTTTTTIDADGNWTVKAPNKFGTFEVTAQAKSGYNTSATSKGSIEVIKQTLDAPVFASPAQDGTATAPVTVIKGSGKASATITLTGDVEGTVVVGEDRVWSFNVSPGLEVGAYTVTAKQTLTDWNDSQTATNKFTVVPVAPAVTSPADGQEFASDQGPDVISGTNIDGATVVVDVNGVQLEAVVVGGTWSVSLGAKLASGEYQITAMQTVDGFESSAGTSAFNVLAAPAPAPTTAPAPAPTTEPAPAPTTEPAPAATPAPADDQLANTGASSPVVLLGAAGGVLLIGGIAFLLFRRRNSES